MKKSQSTLFVVMGLIMLILVGFLFYVMSERNKDVHLGNQLKYYDQKNMRADITSFVENCVEHSVKESFQDTGIRQENLDEYNLDVSEKIISCVEPLFSQIQAQGYLIEEENVHVESEINPETVIVNIKYPLKIKAEAEEINFDRFQYSFDRYTEIKIPGGITDKEIRLISSNGKAELVIPEGVEIKDKDENPVEYVGINVLDRKFDGLENKYVLGELAYENLPDDITFSEPVEFSIEFREEDIPEGYTKDNIKLGYWNEEIKIWYAVPTEIRGNLAIANITHFSKWDMLLGGPHIRVNLVFDKRFNPTGASTESGKQIWLIGGPSEPNDPEFDKGSAVLQKDYFSSSYKEPEKSDFSQYFNTDNGEKEGLDIIKEEYKDEYIDFRTEVFDSTSFLIKPKLQYGYYLNPDNADEDEFVDCESPENGAETKYGNGIYDYFLKDNYPYFRHLQTFSKSDVHCVCEDNDDECYAYCDNEITSREVSENAFCLPIDNNIQLQEDGNQNVTCNYVENPEKDDFLVPSEPTFGWHNYQCVGGRVTPSTSAEVSEFLSFEPDGNAIIFRNTQIVAPYPSKGENTVFDTIWHLGDIVGVAKGIGTWIIGIFTRDKAENLEALQENFENTREFIVSFFDSEENFAFYCEIIPYSDGSLFKEYPAGAIPGTTGPTYGVYGVRVIKRTDHPNSKIDVNSRCELYWTFWGNGFSRTNSDSNNFFEEVLERV